MENSGTVCAHAVDRQDVNIVNIKLIVLIAALLLISGCDKPKKSGFDIICEHFEALEKQPSLANMSKEQRFDFINNLVEKSLSKEDHGYITWNALSTLPEAKYEIFKLAATETTEKPWSCQSMARLAPTVEEGGFVEFKTLPPNTTTMKNATWD